MKLNSRQVYREIYLHIYTLSTFSSRLVLLTKGDLLSLDKLIRLLATKKYHEIVSRLLNSLITSTLSESTNKIYFRLLSLFTNVFCFFVDNVGKFRLIV